MIPAIDWTAVRATLPAYLVRRSYISAELDRYSAGLEFVRLLRKFAPASYQALPDKSPDKCFSALYQWCSERFPLYDLDSLEEWDEGRWGETWYHEYIPVEVMGIDYYNDGVSSPAIALCIGMSVNEESDYYAEVQLNDLECLHDYLDELPPDIQHNSCLPYRIARQRVWREPWNGLWDMYRFALSQTGYGYLDETDLAMQEMNNYPEWNEGHIRDLIRHWHFAKPIWDRVSALVEYIDHDPARHLPALARLLQRDPEALAQATEPRTPASPKVSRWQEVRHAVKRLRVRTLAEAYR